MRDLLKSDLGNPICTWIMLDKNMYLGKKYEFQRMLILIVLKITSY